MKTPEECKEQKNDSRIVLKENRCKITFINDRRFSVNQIRLDDCVFKNQTSCDFLVIDNIDKEHFVELKGCDVPKAIEQLQATIPKISVSPKHQDKACYVVSARVPSKASARTQIWERIFKRDYNSELHIKNRQIEVALG